MGETRGQGGLGQTALAGGRRYLQPLNSDGLFADVAWEAVLKGLLQASFRLLARAAAETRGVVWVWRGPRSTTQVEPAEEPRGHTVLVTTPTGVAVCQKPSQAVSSISTGTMRVRSRMTFSTACRSPGAGEMGCGRAAGKRPDGVRWPDPWRRTRAWPFPCVWRP